MGYTTTFEGQVKVEPPLDAEEIAYLKEFNESRRMARGRGPYYCGTGDYGQDHEPDVLDYNRPPRGQPGLWCKWTPTDDGTAIEWDGAEKFYDAEEWMVYLIEHFLKPGCHAIGQVLAIKGGHTLNGEILAEGEDQGDVWKLIVRDNHVSRKNATLTWGDDEA